MQRRLFLEALGQLARTKGKEAAATAGKTLVRKVARPLGERLAAAAAKAAESRGCEGAPKDLDSLLAQLKQLRDNGDLSFEEFLRRREELFAFMRGKKSNE